jgi:hypothetical protein
LNEENIAMAAEVKTEFGDEDEEANSPLEVKNEEAENV